MDGQLVLMAVPAYGRSYVDGFDLLIDWQRGLDFRILNGPYFSKRDKDILKADGYTHIQFVQSIGDRFETVLLIKL